MKRLAVGWVLLAVAVPGFGSTLTASGSNSLWNIDDPSCSESSSDNCVIGDPTVFGIESASLTVGSSGDVSANILTNFGDSTLAPFSLYGVTFSAADILITAPDRFLFTRAAILGCADFQQGHGQRNQHHDRHQRKQKCKS